MNNRMVRRFIMAFAAAFITLALPAQENETAPFSSISRDTILIGDQIDWTIRLELEEGEEYFVERPAEIPVEGVETIRPLQFDTVSLRKGHMTVEGRTVITSFDSGSYYLPRLMAYIARTSGETDTLVFESPVLEVTTIPIDTATFQPYDIKGQIRYPLTFAEVIPWVGLAALLTALLWGLFRFIRMKKENKSFFGKPVVQDPPHITALRALEKIRSQKLWQNDRQKQFYTAVTDVLRQYMAQRYGISALEQTSAEIMDNLRDKGISEALMERIKDLFTTADYVKFAKHNASEMENEEAIPTAVRFVNETFLQQMDEENAKKEA